MNVKSTLKDLLDRLSSRYKVYGIYKGTNVTIVHEAVLRSINVYCRCGVGTGNGGVPPYKYI